MEIFELISGYDKIKLAPITVTKGELIALEKLISWLSGFQSAKSGDIEGFFELVMLLRHLKREKGELTNGNSLA